jgi:hypothetical protein
MPFLVYQGQNNDITVLHRSPIFDRLATSEALEVKCKISKHDYDIVYFPLQGTHVWMSPKGINRRIKIYT